MLRFFAPIYDFADVYEERPYHGKNILPSREDMTMLQLLAPIYNIEEKFQDSYHHENNRIIIPSRNDIITEIVKIMEKNFVAFVKKRGNRWVGIENYQEKLRKHVLNKIVRLIKAEEYVNTNVVFHALLSKKVVFEKKNHTYIATSNLNISKTVESFGFLTMNKQKYYIKELKGNIIKMSGQNVTNDGKVSKHESLNHIPEQSLIVLKEKSTDSTLDPMVEHERQPKVGSRVHTNTYHHQQQLRRQQRIRRAPQQESGRATPDSSLQMQPQHHQSLHMARSNPVSEGQCNMRMPIRAPSEVRMGVDPRLEPPQVNRTNHPIHVPSPFRMGMDPSQQSRTNPAVEGQGNFSAPIDLYQASMIREMNSRVESFSSRQQTEEQHKDMFKKHFKKRDYDEDSDDEESEESLKKQLKKLKKKHADLKKKHGNLKKKHYQLKKAQSKSAGHLLCSLYPMKIDNPRMVNAATNEEKEDFTRNIEDAEMKLVPLSEISEEPISNLDFPDLSGDSISSSSSSAFSKITGISLISMGMAMYMESFPQFNDEEESKSDFEIPLLSGDSISSCSTVMSHISMGMAMYIKSFLQSNNTGESKSNLDFSDLTGDMVSSKSNCCEITGTSMAMTTSLCNSMIDCGIINPTLASNNNDKSVFSFDEIISVLSSSLISFSTLDEKTMSITDLPQMVILDKKRKNAGTHLDAFRWSIERKRWLMERRQNLISFQCEKRKKEMLPSNNSQESLQERIPELQESIDELSVLSDESSQARIEWELEQEIEKIRALKAKKIKAWEGGSQNVSRKRFSGGKIDFRSKDNCFRRRSSRSVHSEGYAFRSETKLPFVVE